MAFNFSKGNRGFGDINFEDDADTGIDFEADTVKIETGGATRLTVEDSEITTHVPLHISGAWLGHEALRIAATTTSGRNFREIVFERDGVDKAFIQIDSSNGLIIGCASDSDEIIFQTQTGGTLQEAMRVRHGAVGIGTDSPTKSLDIIGDIRVNGGVYKKLIDVDANYTATTSDYMLRCIQDASITITLPTKANNAGQILVIKDMMGNAGSPNNKTITIDAHSSETIDGSTTYTIAGSRQAITLMCDGINGWMIIGRYSL